VFVLHDIDAGPAANIQTIDGLSLRRNRQRQHRGGHQNIAKSHLASPY
jgi:hypothetical protein